MAITLPLTERHVIELIPFIVPPDSTLKTAKQPFDKEMEHEDRNLIEIHFKTPRPTGRVRGGLYPMSKDYFKPKDVAAELKKIQERTGHNIRLGTPEEAFHYVRQQPSAKEEWFLIPGKVCGEYVVGWKGYFSLFLYADNIEAFDNCFLIFIVEEI